MRLQGCYQRQLLLSDSLARRKNKSLLAVACSQKELVVAGAIWDMIDPLGELILRLANACRGIPMSLDASKWLIQVLPYRSSLCLSAGW